MKFKHYCEGTPSSGEFCLALSTEGDYILENCSAVYPFLCLDTGKFYSSLFISFNIILMIITS